MVNFSRPLFAPYLNRMLSRSLVVGAIASVSWLSGLAPDLSGHSRALDFNSAAYAQEVSEPEVTNYARAVLGIEPVRQEAYDEIKKFSVLITFPQLIATKAWMHYPTTLGRLPIITASAPKL